MEKHAPAFVVIALAVACAGAARADDTSAGGWARETGSPVPIVAPRSDLESALLARCGAGEARLSEVARSVAARKLSGRSYLDLDGLAFSQRRAGEPHVWPRAWIVSGRALDEEATLRKLDAWRQGFHDVGERRCGVATEVAADGTRVVAAVAVDALADLAPLPVRAHAGQWLEVDARMLVPATSASVVVLGPSGAPHTALTSFSHGHVRARFAPDRPGAFTVQIVADVETGPRPVLEASVYADVEPPADLPDRAAPGEGAGVGAPDLDSALTRMIAGMRADEQLAPIARDAALDRLARAHALLMQRQRTLGHDVGDGDPALRLRDAGLAAREAGENVAHSPSVALAHRALYASPSHRANLLRPDFDAMGIAVVEDADGSVWVDEIFAGGLR